MHKITLERYRTVIYPNICPICAKKGEFTSYPMGSFGNDQESKKIEIPLHTKCWRYVNIRILIFTILMISSICLIEFIYPTPLLSFKSFLIYLPIYITLWLMLPPAIAIDCYNERIQFKFKNLKYASAFKKLNSKIIVKNIK